MLHQASATESKEDTKEFNVRFPNELGIVSLDANFSLTPGKKLVVKANQVRGTRSFKEPGYVPSNTFLSDVVISVILDEPRQRIALRNDPDPGRGSYMYSAIEFSAKFHTIDYVSKDEFNETERREELAELVHTVRFSSYDSRRRPEIKPIIDNAEKNPRLSLIRALAILSSDVSKTLLEPSFLNDIPVYGAINNALLDILHFATSTKVVVTKNRA